MVIIKPEPRLAWDFVVADVKFPIIGADFLRYYGLLVDMRHNTPPHFSAFMEQYPKCVLLALFWSSHLNQSTWTYSMNFQPSPNQSRKKEVPNTTLPTLSSLKVHQCIRIKPRRLAPEKLKYAKSEFDNPLAFGIIAPSLSCWASPLHIVPQKTPGTWRP